MRQGWAIPAGGGSEGMRDYHVYRMNWRERFLCIGITFVLSGMVSWLFYRSFWGMLSLPVFCVPVRKAVRESLMRKRRQEMLFHFREMLQMASAAVKAGYAMENAIDALKKIATAVIDSNENDGVAKWLLQNAK